MSLFNKWEELAGLERSEEEYDEFWENYFHMEESNYKYILSNKVDKITGTVNELAKNYNMDIVAFTGFIYGINTSLVNPIELENLEETTEINMEIDFEKLFFNMLDAKAELLYTLPEWEDILSDERRSEITKEFRKSKIVVKEEKVGRNDPCPCGSGKKYKKCCGQNM
jgi:hypothetical protein